MNKNTYQFITRTLRKSYMDWSLRNDIENSTYTLETDFTIDQHPLIAGSLGTSKSIGAFVWMVGGEGSSAYRIMQRVFEFWAELYGIEVEMAVHSANEWDKLWHEYCEMQRELVE